jgi:FMN-dependent oxidoreductase (nitrilotriacetate monooxygenase family)
MMSTGPARQMNLAAFVSAGPVSGHHGGWRYPTADRDLLSAGYYTRLGRILEAGKFDLLFLADILSIPNRYEGRMDSQLRHGALGAVRLDPLLVLSTIAAVTSRLGLASTVSTSYFHPFDVARSLATLDHLSGGRAGWNIVTSFQDAEAENFGLVEQLSRDDRYDRADEFMSVACKLWDSWADDALRLDPVTPLFADPAGVHPIDHDGRWFKVRGPLNVSRSPQGRPVFIQAGASNRGRDFAARWAEVVFVTYGSLEQGVAFYTDMKRRAAAFGRDPDQLKILPGMVPVVGASDAEAQAKSMQLDSLADPEAGLSTLSYHLDIDLSPFPKDGVLPELDPKGVSGHYHEVAELTRRNGLSLSALGKRYATGPLRDFIGSGKAVADRMAAWFEAGACDGFMVQMPFIPGGAEDFIAEVIPELQRRGLFRQEYEGETLRDHLGLKRPAA